jgi:hypothetical protein
LNELNDGGGEFADPIDDEAKEEPPLCGAIHTHAEGKSTGSPDCEG